MISKKDIGILEADIITIKKTHQFDVSSSKDAFFTGRVLNDRHCAYLSNKSLMGCIYFETPYFCSNISFIESDINIG